MSVIAALAIPFNLPLFWVFEWHINENGTVISVLNEEFVCGDKAYIVNYITGYGLIVKLIIPMAILIVSSICIIKKVPI